MEAWPGTGGFSLPSRAAPRTEVERGRRHGESERRVNELWLRAQRRAVSWKAFGFTPKRERKAEAKLLGLL